MAAENIVTITKENFESEVIKCRAPVLVDFWAEWCGPCKMLSPVLDELANEKGDSVKIAKVNLDDNRELSVEYNVKSIPMLLFSAFSRLNRSRLTEHRNYCQPL